MKLLPTNEFEGKEIMTEAPQLSHLKNGNQNMPIFCDEPGCNKSFKRTDHLTRHKRNHVSKNLFTCTWSGCTKSFVRRDVWSKHMQRHVARQEKQKQDLQNGPIQFLEIYTPNSNFDEVARKRRKSSNISSISKNHDENHSLNDHQWVHIPNHKFQNEQIPLLANSKKSDISESSLLDRQKNTEVSCSSDEFQELNSQTNEENIDMEISRTANYRCSTNTDVNSATKNLTNSTVNNAKYSENTEGYLNIDNNKRPASMDFGNLICGPETNKDTPTELIHWMLNGHALYSEPFHKYLDYSPDSPLKNLLNISSPFPISNYQVDISDTTKSKLVEFIPSLLCNPDFNIRHIKECLGSYWNIFHVQYPILHKPSFSTLEAHPLLLLSMISMGASLRSRNNRFDCNSFKNIHKLADEIAEPLRWLIFSTSELTAHITPWVIQSLLIVECYENSCSNRRLHQRAYLHHGLKIQLLRRSPLLGGNSLRNTNSDDGLTDEVDAWKKWIDIESLKRCAFMAFLIDAIHATIYGHETILFTHQIKLSLPCDEILWEMTDFKSNYLPPRTETPKFLNALSKLLHKEKFETGAFNKRILFAGLLTTMFGMEQRDIQVKEFEWESVKSSWKETIFGAIEFWFEDMCHGSCCNITTGYYVPSDFETLPASLKVDDTTCKLAMYHLSQAFLRVQQYDCIIYAGVPSRMNVRTNYSDYEIVKKRIHEWANSYNGRISVVHAYLFISEMLLSLNESRENILLSYDPNEDPILYRPNVVASLLFVIWCYNYCLEGPESNTYPNPNQTTSTLTLNSQKTGLNFDMATKLSTKYLPEKVNGYRYISRINASFKLCSIGPVKLTFVDIYAKALDQVMEKNCTVGLLRLFKDKYENCNSQICQEYGKLLENCIQRSLGKTDVICDNMYENSS